MTRSADHQLTVRREHHVGNVIPLRRTVTVATRHPSLAGRELFDQDTATDTADCVLVTKPEAVRIAALLDAARTHLPSPKACDEAIALLTGRPRTKGHT